VVAVSLKKKKKQSKKKKKNKNKHKKQKKKERKRRRRRSNIHPSIFLKATYRTTSNHNPQYQSNTTFLFWLNLKNNNKFSTCQVG